MNHDQNDSKASQFLSRGIDYLGDLGAKLRDLQGFKILAHELIQNADDVPTATKMTFDVYDDALIVENNGIFSDCGEVEKTECPWKEEKGHRCDFHRFRYVASGDKRAEEGTTGAFGIGFIAVYQITDRPELISHGRHWTLREEKHKNERIKVCSGCKKCRDTNLPGTRFIFPWAKDTNSFLRKALRTSALTEDDIKTLFSELDQSLPPSMLFLKRLNKIELKRNGRSHRIFEKLPPESNSLILANGNSAEDQIWHIFHGNFESEAEELRKKYQGRIEEKRLSQVTIAIPEKNTCKGLFCVTLPTEQETGLPFHINADFFPSNDRKRLNLTSGYEAEWNRSAIKAAAKILANNLDRLRDLLGHKPLWELLQSIKNVSKEAGSSAKDSTLAAFWEEIHPKLQTEEIVFTTDNKWTIARKCRLLLRHEEVDAVPLMEKLGMKIVSEDLRRFHSLLREVDVPILGLSDFCNALLTAGLNKPLEKNEWKRILGEQDRLKELWKEIALLRDREKNPSNKAEVEEFLRHLAIAPVSEDKLYPFDKVFKADKTTRDLFSIIQQNIPFLSENPDIKPLQDICRDFNVEAAIDVQESLESKKITDAWEKKHFDIENLFKWFENHKQEILENPQVKERFRNLPIFPASDQLHKLDDLVIPGNFEDPLGLTDLIDLTSIGNRREFLKEIGMQSLDFKTYSLRLRKSLLKPEISITKRRAVVELLAKRLGEIKDYPEVRESLVSTPLVECTDDMFRKPQECYFKSELVVNCLGPSVFIAISPKKNTSAIHSLYEWLGITKEPRTSDLLKRVKEISNSPYKQELLQTISKIIEFLGKKYKEQQPPDEFEELKEISWLPAEGKQERWYRPNELYAVFQKYLFETQALFLDIRHNIQTSSSSFFQFLGIHNSPETKLVVNHLLHCANKKLPVHREIYRFLNDKAGDQAVRKLKGEKCLYINENYLSPDNVFWSEQPFGRYRQQLGEELYSYKKLFDELGVHDKPDYKDAVAVLKEIAEKYGSRNQKIDEETRNAVLACWQMLDDEIDRDDFDEDLVKSLKEVKCIPNPQDLLYPPDWMFFENRAGLAEKFVESISKNVINKPMKGGEAMMLAGVRLLGSAVEIQLIECDNPSTDTKIETLIKERHRLFARILDSNTPDNSVKTSEILERLDGIRFESARSLKIQYKLKAFRRIFEGKQETTSALYQSNEKRLIFTRENGEVRWPAFSRELAIALFPDQDPGKISSNLKEVLAPEDLEQVRKTLDELGFPILDTTTPSTASNNQQATSLGTDSDIPDTYQDVPQDSEIVVPSITDNISPLPTESIPKESVGTGEPPQQSAETKDAVAPPNVIDYNNELQKSFNRPGETELQEQITDNGKVRNLYRRREKSYDEHKERLHTEPKPEERRRKTIRTILEGPNEQVREYLSQFYDGKCQICDKTFPERDGKSFFIAKYIVERKHARSTDTYANALCLCADHFAQWQHGSVEAGDIIEQIQRFKTEREKGTGEPVLKIKLCGVDCLIKFKEKHLLDLQELLRASEDENKDAFYKTR